MSAPLKGTEKETVSLSPIFSPSSAPKHRVSDGNARSMLRGTCGFPQRWQIMPGDPEPHPLGRQAGRRPWDVSAGKGGCGNAPLQAQRP